MTTPTGIWAEPEVLLATMLSVCPAFQDFVDVGGSSGGDEEDAALARIHYEGLPEPEDDETGQYTREELEEYRPCAIVTTVARGGWQAKPVAEQTWETSGRVAVGLYRSLSTTRHGLPTAEDIADMRSDVSEILEELLSLPWEEPYLAPKQVRVTDGPFFGDPEDVPSEGLWIGVEIEVEY